MQCAGEYGVLVVEVDEEKGGEVLIQEQQQFCIIHYPRLTNISTDSQAAPRWPLALIKVRKYICERL